MPTPMNPTLKVNFRPVHDQDASVVSSRSKLTGGERKERSCSDPSKAGTSPSP
jgi:hypothetical protein